MANRRAVEALDSNLLLHSNSGLRGHSYRLGGAPRCGHLLVPDSALLLPVVGMLVVSRLEAAPYGGSLGLESLQVLHSVACHNGRPRLWFATNA